MRPPGCTLPPRRRGRGFRATPSSRTIEGRASVVPENCRYGPEVGRAALGALLARHGDIGAHHPACPRRSARGPRGGHINRRSAGAGCGAARRRGGYPWGGSLHGGGAVRWAIADRRPAAFRGGAPRRLSGPAGPCAPLPRRGQPGRCARAVRAPRDGRLWHAPCVVDDLEKLNRICLHTPALETLLARARLRESLKPPQRPS